MARLAKRYTAGRPGASRQSAAKEVAEKERKKKNNRLCVSMVVIFGTCWFPLNLMNFLGDIDVRIFCWEYHHLAFFVCHVLAMSSNCYNPFLYGWLNESFRTEFFKMIPLLATICGPADNGGRAANGQPANGQSANGHQRNGHKAMAMKVAVAENGEVSLKRSGGKEFDPHGSGEPVPLVPRSNGIHVTAGEASNGGSCGNGGSNGHAVGAAKVEDV